MSPAILLVPRVLRRQWRPLAATALVSLVFVAAAPPLAALETQLRFFTVVLPGLGAGSYNGMSVPLDLNANHSLANVFHQLLPSGSDHALSLPPAPSPRRAAPGCWPARPRRPEPAGTLGEGAALRRPGHRDGGHAGLHLRAPPRAPPAGRRRGVDRGPPGAPPPVEPRPAGRGLRRPAVAGRVRQALRAAPELGWLIRESKLVGALTVGGLCLWAAHRSPRSGSEAPSGR